MKRLASLLLCLVAFSCSAQTILTADGLATFGTNSASGGGGGGNTTFIVSGHGATTRHNFSGVVGFVFSVSSSITITDLGRIVVSGNTATHIVYLEDATGNVLAQTSALVTSGVTADTYVYGAITPTAISTGQNYFVVSAELNSGDDWYTDDANVTSTADGTVAGSSFANSPGIALSAGTSGTRSYVPTNFKYTKP